MPEDQNHLENNLTDSSEKMHLELQSYIEKGLRSLQEGSLIGKLSYVRSKSKSKSHKEIELIYKNNTESSSNKNSRLYPNIVLKSGGREVAFPIEWALTKAKDDSHIKLWLKSFGVSWEFLEFDQDEGIKGLFKEGEISLPRANGVNEYFMKFWFGDDEETSLKNEKAAIERKAPIWSKSAFKSGWEYIKFDEKLIGFKVDELPILPMLTEGDDSDVDDKSSPEEWAEFLVVILTWRSILTFLSFDKTELKTKEEEDEFINTLNKKFNLEEIDRVSLENVFKELPFTHEYKPKRPIDVNSQSIYELIKDEGLEIPWHVVSSVSAALNAGKHIIFSGPPGCGKTKIAKLIAQKVSKNVPIVATASQAWSTDEIIGRYMPSVKGEGLVFKEGFFLKALEQGKWLLIDEINRCDIDNCFGELFTVLSGQSVDLPFEKVTVDSKDDVPLPIRIDVGSNKGEANTESNYVSYPCSETFRFLATMNDADISGLNQLSFALRRRFAMIRIDAPNDKGKLDIFDKEIEQVFGDLGLVDNSEDKKVNGNRCYKMKYKNRPIAEPGKLKDKIEKLFACENDNGVDDLIDLGVLGIAPVLDIIRFVGEGLRAPDEKRNRIDIDSNDLIDRGESGSHLMNSFIAMGLVMSVFPQLDAVSNEQDRFKNAIRRIIAKTFNSDDLFLRIEEVDSELTLKGTEVKSNGTGQQSYKTINEYLIQELNSQYAKDPNAKEMINEIVEEMKCNG